MSHHVCVSLSILSVLSARPRICSLQQIYGSYDIFDVSGAVQRSIAGKSVSASIGRGIITGDVARLPTLSKVRSLRSKSLHPCTRLLQVD